MNGMIHAGLDGCSKERRAEGEKVRTLKRKKEFRDLRFHSTWDIIDAAGKGQMSEI